MIRADHVITCIALLSAAAVIGWIAFVSPSSELIADDIGYAAGLQGNSLIDFVSFRYMRWSGRLPIDALAPLVVGNDMLWKPLNALCLLALCSALATLATHGSRSVMNRFVKARWLALAAGGLLLVPHVVMADAVFWRTGSINYLWPCALGAWGIVGFLDPPGRRALRLARIAAACFGVYNEQVAIVLVPLAIVLTFVSVRNERPSRGWDIAQCLLMLGNASVLLLAPGNRNRIFVEAQVRFPDFPTLSVLDRLTLGVHRALEGVVGASGHVVMLLALLLTVSLSASRLPRDCRWLLGGACLLIALGPLLALVGFGDGLLRNWYSLAPLNGMAAMSARIYALHALWTIVTAIVFIGAALAWPVQRLAESAITVLSLGMGFASVVALGFSPSVHESGARVFFVIQVVLLAVLLRRLALYVEQEPFLKFRIWRRTRAL